MNADRQIFNHERRESLIRFYKETTNRIFFCSPGIRHLAPKVLHVNAGKVTPYVGGYDYFLEKTGALHNERATLTAG